MLEDTFCVIKTVYKWIVCITIHQKFKINKMFMISIDIGKNVINIVIVPQYKIVVVLEDINKLLI